MSPNRLLLCLLVTSLLLPAVSAGTQADPEIDDPDAGTVTRECTPSDTTGPVCNAAASGDPNTGPTASGSGNVVKVWITEPDDENYTIHIEMGEAPTADTDFTVNYTVTPTNVSLYTGSDTPTSHSIAFSGTTAPATPANTTVASNATNATIVELTVTRRDTSAVGGDSITGLSVAVTHEEGDSAGTGPATISWTDTTTDTAPNDPVANPSRPYNLTRPPIVPDLELTVVGGSITHTVNGTSNTTTFMSNQVTTEGPDATVTFDLVLTNTGTDPDDATITLFDPTGALAADNVEVTISPATTGELLPGEAANVTVTATLTEAGVGQHPILLQADSGRGAIAASAMQVTVPAPPPPPTTQPPPTGGNGSNGGGNGGNQDPAEREPVPAGLSFLTPMAEALGLDGPFNEYAELVLLALLLLLLILIVFLIVFFATRGAVAVDVEPRVVTARPGETAEFSVAVRNKRGRPMDAVTHFEGDPAWRTGLVFGDAQLTQSHTDAQLGLGPKQRDSGTRMGKLMVTVPPEAHDDETDQIKVAVSALNESGRPVKTRTANVKVRAVGGAPPVVQRGDLPVRLASVQHVPEEPVAGETVQTTARLENDSDTDTLELRVVLNVGGDDVQEQNVVLPPRNARAVVFRWEAPQGSSKVRVRVYPQD